MRASENLWEPWFEPPISVLEETLWSNKKKTRFVEHKLNQEFGFRYYLKEKRFVLFFSHRNVRYTLFSLVCDWFSNPSFHCKFMKPRGSIKKCTHLLWEADVSKIANSTVRITVFSVEKRVCCWYLSAKTLFCGIVAFSPWYFGSLTFATSGGR